MGENKKTMGSHKFKARALVLIQALCVAVILLTGGPLAKSLPLLILELAGIALVFWAFAAMGLKNLTATPLVKADASLVTTGPYALIRHPMYAALLLVVWILAVDRCTLLRLAAAAVLTVNLTVKLLFEERLLKAHFAGYGAYMEKTWRLIPFLF